MEPHHLKHNAVLNSKELGVGQFTRNLTSQNEMSASVTPTTNQSSNWLEGSLCRSNNSVTELVFENLE